MPRRRTRNDWKATHELHRRTVGVASRGGDPDTIANEIHDIYLRHGAFPAPVPAATPRCQIHYMTALENGRCPIPTCGWSPKEPGAGPAVRNDVRINPELHRAVVAAIRRGGDVDTIATSIHTIYRRNGWRPHGPAGLNVSRCRYHPGMHLKNGRCPACGWNPNGPEN